MRHYHPLPRYLYVISSFSHSRCTRFTFWPNDEHSRLRPIRLALELVVSYASKHVHQTSKFTQESFKGTATIKGPDKRTIATKQNFTQQDICLTSQPAPLYNCLCLSTCIPNNCTTLQHSPLRSFVFATLLSISRTHDWTAKNAKVAEESSGPDMAARDA